MDIYFRIFRGWRREGKEIKDINQKGTFYIATTNNAKNNNLLEENTKRTKIINARSTSRNQKENPNNSADNNDK